ncbi:hypothetical protein [Pyrodictium abyssi]|uniref:hypothetical protein n=1 Tax=Pyrodictium abyssi TaxID=54256 RepID=UPI0030C77FC9
MLRRLSRFAGVFAAVALFLVFVLLVALSGPHDPRLVKLAIAGAGAIPILVAIAVLASTGGRRI